MQTKALLSVVDAALKGDRRTAEMAIRKLASTVRTTDKNLYDKIASRLSGSVVRNTNASAPPTPVDSDSRLDLVRVDHPSELTEEPVHSHVTRESLNQVILERVNADALRDEGLWPTKSLIFQGPPGVGKTLSAKWLAKELDLPLLTLDLATVMSSFLGKTGSNIRTVLDHAASFPCILLLDEFDAVAKRRDDDRELGELKRLVTVLLQAIDEWPESSILIAATNHGELLDPAIWRRFDAEIEFQLPDKSMVEQHLAENWGYSKKETKEIYPLFEGRSFSDISRILRKTKKASILSGIPIHDCIIEEKQRGKRSLSLYEKKGLVLRLHESGKSQRAISLELGISRPTIKKVLEQANLKGQ